MELLKIADGGSGFHCSDGANVHPFSKAAYGAHDICSLIVKLYHLLIYLLPDTHLLTFFSTINLIYSNVCIFTLGSNDN